MTITSLRNILRPALTEGYGVPAINVFNDLTLEGVLEAAVAERSPVIVQTSVKTVRSIGSDALWSMWASMTRGIQIPLPFHLDHSPPPPPPARRGNPPPAHGGGPRGPFPRRRGRRRDRIDHRRGRRHRLGRRRRNPTACRRHRFHRTNRNRR